jgi:regulatory protein YycH of two-component signal transduction system YycFG
MLIYILFEFHTGVQNVTASWQDKKVIVEATANPDDIEAQLKKTGKKVTRKF